MAVYTRVDEDQLKDLLSGYGIGELTSFSGITQGVENSNYRLSTTGGEFILTLYEKRVDRADLPFFIGLMGHMANAGINCPKPVEDTSGQILQDVSDRAAAIVTFLDGTWSNSPTPQRCRAAGAVLARMHLAGADYMTPRRNALNSAGWMPLLEASDKGQTDGLLPDLWAQAKTRLEGILADWPHDLPHGVIHADLFPDNVLFIGDRVTGVIDFYFACNDFIAYDLAIMLNAWCFEPDGSFNITKALQLVSGYQSTRPLSEAEIAAIPVLCRGAAMRFFLTRLYDWINTPADAQVRPHDPMDYWRRLNFHHQVNTPKAYGFGG